MLPTFTDDKTYDKTQITNRKTFANFYFIRNIQMQIGNVHKIILSISYLFN